MYNIYYYRLARALFYVFVNTFRTTWAPPHSLDFSFRLFDTHTVTYVKHILQQHIV